MKKNGRLFLRIRVTLIPMLLVTLSLITLIPASAAAEREIPDILRVTQEIEIYETKHYQVIAYSVLHSAREDINEMIMQRVNALTEEAEPLVPPGNKRRKKPARADIFTQITRTGDRWMSFHICAQVSADNEQKWVRSEEYTYDMETGRLIRLGDIIREDGWEKLIREVRTQAANAFQEDEADPERLDALYNRESLAEAGFVMTPGHLALYFPAGDLYPIHEPALLRVEIYVPELREILTDEARQETDCTGYDLVALTYDDGPTKGSTWKVLNVAACHPGQVTFFLIGKRLQKNAELVHREFDAGHSVQSHTWQHSTKQRMIKPENVAEWEKEYNQTMGAIIGVTPVMMRPPGGYGNLYLNAGADMPIVQWSINSKDAEAQGSGSLSFYYYSAMSAEDGDIVLFHDVRTFAPELADKCMKRFEERNVLLVTVNDLCALRGIPLEGGFILNNCPKDGEE